MTAFYVIIHIAPRSSLAYYVSQFSNIMVYEYKYSKLFEYLIFIMGMNFIFVDFIDV